MSDNSGKPGGVERRRINVLEEYDLRHWAEKFGVVAGDLKEAVKLVGDRPDAVEAHLKRQRHEDL